MVVCQRAAIDLAGPQAPCIFGAYPVVDTLVRAVIAARDGGLEIDDARIRLHAR
jgi:hypothetical protein